jgi:hypothetical protein
MQWRERFSAAAELRTGSNGWRAKRTVAVAFNEAIAIKPMRVLRIELKVLREQCCRNISSAKRSTGMTLARVFDGIHREEPDRI